jgi:hypothetical protein
MVKFIDGKWQQNWFERNFPTLTGFVPIFKYILIVGVVVLVFSKIEPYLTDDTENKNYEDDYSCYYTGPVEVCG